jgi:hypothetical protein
MSDFPNPVASCMRVVWCWDFKSNPITTNWSGLSCLPMVPADSYISSINLSASSSHAPLLTSSNCWSALRKSFFSFNAYSCINPAAFSLFFSALRALPSVVATCFIYSFLFSTSWCLNLSSFLASSSCCPLATDYLSSSFWS